MKIKSVALVSNNYWTLYKFRYDVIDLFCKNDIKVYLIAKEDGYSKYFMKDNIMCNFVNFNERKINVFNEVYSLFNLTRILKDINPDIVLNFTIKPNIYSGIACKYLKIEYISMITGLGYIFLQSNIFINFIANKILRYSLSGAKKIWFTNNYDKDVFIKKNIVNRKNIEIMPGAGADFSIERSFKKEPQDQVTFTMIARLLNEKGVFEFIETAKYFHKYNKYKFVLVGLHKENNKHFLNKKVLDNVIKKNIIEYKNFTDNIEDYYKKTSCIILPSYREGLSTILLEAAVLRIPIITTRVPGCQDIVPNENYGFLCKPKSIDSLIETIKAFINTDAQDILSKTEKTYDHVKMNFSRDSILKKYCNIFNL